MLGSLSTSHPLSLHFRRWPHKKSDKFLHHSGNFSGWSSSEDFVLIQEMNLVFYICQFNVHETPKFETLLILRELPALGQKDFCNAGSNDDEITSRGSTPCCWEKRDCQEWISQSNNSSFQPLSSVKQGFKLWFNQFLADITWNLSIPQDFSRHRPVNEQYGAADLLGSVKKDRNGDRPCDSTKAQQVFSETTVGSNKKWLHIMSEQLGPSNLDLEAK